MKKLLVGSVILIIVFLAAWLLLPLTVVNTNSGSFNTITGLISCEDEASCIHEIGHKLDRDSDWQSQTPEFSAAVKTFILVELSKTPPDPMAQNIILKTGIFDDKVSYPTSPLKEVYAYLFEWAGGEVENMPAVFRPFYDWVLAEKYIAQYLDNN